MAETKTRGPSRAFLVIAGLLVAAYAGLHVAEWILAPRTSRWGELDVAELGSGTTAYVVLHGRGNRLRHGVAIAEAMHAHLPGRYVVPAGPLAIGDGHAWVHWNVDTEPHTLDEPSALRSRAALLDVCARVRREGATRLVLVGMSEGAQVAGDVGLVLDPPPDAIVMFAGNWMPSWDEAGVPGRTFVLVHGRDDGIFPFEGIEWLANDLSDRGAHVTFIQFPGGHEVGPLEPVAEALRPLLAPP